MKNVSESNSDIKFVVWTGWVLLKELSCFRKIKTFLFKYDSDDLSHASEDVFTKEETLKTISNISSMLSTIGSFFLTLRIRISILYISTGLPVFPSLGNHDIIPKNQYPTPDTSDSWTDYYDQDRFRFLNGISEKIFFQFKSI